MNPEETFHPNWGWGQWREAGEWHHAPKARKKISDARHKEWADPEMREKRLAGYREWWDSRDRSPMKCEHCEREFQGQHGLDVHRRNIRPAQCPYCEHVACNANALARHVDKVNHKAREREWKAGQREALIREALTQPENHGMSHRDLGVKLSAVLGLNPEVARKLVSKIRKEPVR